MSGERPRDEGAFSKGYFVPPTVFANVHDNMLDRPGGDLRLPGDFAIPSRTNLLLIPGSPIFATTSGSSSASGLSNGSRRHLSPNTARRFGWVNSNHAMTPAFRSAAKEAALWGPSQASTSGRVSSQRQGGLDKTGSA